jgi:hypothetical protein
LTPNFLNLYIMDPGPVKIYTTTDTPRLRYITEIILGDILGLSWDIVTDKRKLGKNPVINYTQFDITGSFKITPYGILSEKGLRNIQPTVSDWNKLPVFFQTNDNSDLPFDIFAASFYLVSRYEEYLEFKPDKFGRFSASNSFAFINKFLTRPVVDLWTREFAKALLIKFRNMTFKRNMFHSVVTMDIDLPFAYLGKDFFRSIGAFLKELGHSTVKAGQRYRTLAKGEKDPFDVFDYIFGTLSENKSSAHFFIPTGNRSDYDKNPSWQNVDFRNLILRVKEKFPVGLHPSFAASLNSKSMNIEKIRLQEIVSTEIKSSRFHFIRMRLPDSYRNLISNGITEDYSMGFPDEPGFRAGIARPFYFYDLNEDKKTVLKIHPFQVMDITLIRYLGLSPEVSIELIASLIDETRRAGGFFMSLWHNTSLLESEEWKKWRKTFETMLSLQNT